MTGFATALSALTLDQRNTMRRVLETQGPEFNAFPLSFEQERLWFLQQLDPASSSYNVPIALTVAGPLDEHALIRAIDEVVRRHEILRTVFLAVEGHPVQIVKPPRAVGVTRIDLERRDGEERLVEARRIAREVASAPFDLCDGPLLRAVLVRLHACEHILILIFHHIVVDGPSLDIFRQELFACYRVLKAGGDRSPLPELQIQYADYAVWQRASLSASRLARGVSFWKRQLEGAPNADLPPPRTAVPAAAGAWRRLALSDQLSEVVGALCRAHGVTMSMGLLAAYAVALYRCIGTDDLVILMPATNRTARQTENLIGFFVNLLPLRITVSRDSSFAGVVAEARAAVLAAHAHVDIPYDRIVQATKRADDLSSPAAAPFSFDFAHAGANTTALDDLIVGPFPIELRARSKVALALHTAQDGDRLRGAFEYDPDRLAEPEVEALSRTLVSILEEGAAERPNRAARISPASRAAAVAAGRAHNPTSFDHSNLSDSQLRIWSSQRAYPELPLYSLAGSTFIPVALDAERVLRAFETLVRSSDALRTVIEVTDGTPQQRITPHVRPAAYVDFSARECPRTAFHDWLEHRRHLLLDPGEPLFDAALVKLADAEFVWHLRHHQLVADEFTHVLVARHLARLYGAAGRGRLPDRVALPSFSEYVAWHRSRKTSPACDDEDLTSSRRAAAADPVALYGSVPAGPSLTTEATRIELSPEDTRRLEPPADLVQVDRAQRPLVLLLSILAVFLCQASGRRTFVVGAEWTNRRSWTHRRTIGSCSEIAPIPVSIGATDTFSALVCKVASEWLNAIHRGAAGAACPMRRPFAALLSMRNAGPSHFAGAPVAFEWSPVAGQLEWFALRAHRERRTGRTVLEFGWNRGLLNEALRHEAMRHFRSLLRRLLDEPDTRAARPGLLAECAA